MTMHHEVVQRVRVLFAVSEPLTHVSVLDMGRTWERLLRRAQVPIAYSQGFNPHAQIQFATALPVGYGSTCELVDLSLGQAMEPEELLEVMRRQLPSGLRLLNAYNVEIKAKPLQALMREALYAVTIYTSAPAERVESAIQELLARQEIPRQREKKGRMSSYNLRPLILDVKLSDSCSASHQLDMHLLCGPQGSGRPEEIVQELPLAINQYTILRTALIWKQADSESDKEALS